MEELIMATRLCSPRHYAGTTHHLHGWAGNQNQERAHGRYTQYFLGMILYNQLSMRRTYTPSIMQATRMSRDDCSLVVALGMTLKADGCLVGQSEDRNGIPSESKKLGRGVYWKCQRHNAKGRGAHCPTQVRVIEHKYRNEAQVQFKGKCNHEAAVSTAKKWNHEQWQQFQASAAQGHTAKELQARMQGAGLPEMQGVDLKRKARESLARLKVLCACLNVIIYELHMFVYCRKKQHPMR